MTHFSGFLCSLSRERGQETTQTRGQSEPKTPNAKKRKRDDTLSKSGSRMDFKSIRLLPSSSGSSSRFCDGSVRARGLQEPMLARYRGAYDCYCCCFGSFFRRFFLLFLLISFPLFPLFPLFPPSLHRTPDLVLSLTRLGVGHVYCRIVVAESQKVKNRKNRTKCLSNSKFIVKTVYLPVY